MGKNEYGRRVPRDGRTAAPTTPSLPPRPTPARKPLNRGMIIAHEVSRHAASAIYAIFRTFLFLMVPFGSRSSSNAEQCTPSTSLRKRHL